MFPVTAKFTSVKFVKMSYFVATSLNPLVNEHLTYVYMPQLIPMTLHPWTLRHVDSGEHINSALPAI